MRISTQKVGKLKKMGGSQTLIDVILGFVANSLRLIDVNAGGVQLKKGQGILQPSCSKGISLNPCMKGTFGLPQVFFACPEIHVFLDLDGRNRSIIFAELLARVIATI